MNLKFKVKPGGVCLEPDTKLMRSYKESLVERALNHGGTCDLAGGRDCLGDYKNAYMGPGVVVCVPVVPAGEEGGWKILDQPGMHCEALS